MGWWSDVRKQRAEQWFSGPVAVTGAGAPSPPLEQDATYLNVFLEAIYLPYVRKGLSRFYGALTSTCTTMTALGAMEKDVAVSMPDGLRNADAKHLDRVVVDRRRLLGPIPYSGNDLEIEAGLFSIPTANLIAPYLAVLQDVAHLASLIPVAQAGALVAEPVIAGLKGLLGEADGDSVLEIGLVKLMSPPSAGYFAAVGTTISGTPVYDLGMRTLSLGGQPLAVPYLVISIYATAQRPDWARVPELKAAWEEMVREAQSGDVHGVTLALDQFSRRVRLSEDLIPEDGERLIDKAEAVVDRALGLSPTPLEGARTAASHGPGDPAAVAQGRMRLHSINYRTNLVLKAPLDLDSLLADTDDGATSSDAIGDEAKLDLPDFSSLDLYGSG